MLYDLVSKDLVNRIS